MQQLPVALAEIISKPKECGTLFVTPFDKLNYHVMKIIDTLTANYLQNNPQQLFIAACSKSEELQAPRTKP